MNAVDSTRILICIPLLAAEDIGDKLQDYVNTLSKDCPPSTSSTPSTESVVIALVALDAIQIPESNTGSQ